jgi:hypothetical protein
LYIYIFIVYGCQKIILKRWGKIQERAQQFIYNEKYSTYEEFLDRSSLKILWVYMHNSYCNIRKAALGMFKAERIENQII